MMFCGFGVRVNGVIDVIEDVSCSAVEDVDG